jgi:hypothetical protein
MMVGVEVRMPSTSLAVSVFLFLALVVLSANSSTTIVAAQSSTPRTSTSEANVQLIDALRLALKKRNHLIERVTIVELRALPPDGPHVLIGEGVRQDQRFQGSFEDELFGVFLVDSKHTRIESTLEIMPTPRWLDYRMRIESLTATRLVVVGKGDTYGDQPLRRVYNLKGK